MVGFAQRNQKYVEFYNNERRHESLGYETPVKYYLQHQKYHKINLTLKNSCPRFLGSIILEKYQNFISL